MAEDARPLVCRKTSCKDDKGVIPMSDSVKLWLFLLFLPFLAAVGHDLYASYYAPEEQRARIEALEIDPTVYQMSDFGYLFTAYTPEFYENTRTAVGEDSWKNWVDPILKLYTIVVALIPLGLFVVWLLISRIFDIWPFSEPVAKAARAGAKQKDRLEQLNKREGKGGQFKFKRR